MKSGGVCRKPGSNCISNPAVMLHVNLRDGVPHTSDTTSINTTLLLIIIISPFIVLARPVRQKAKVAWLSRDRVDRVLAEAQKGWSSCLPEVASDYRSFVQPGKPTVMHSVTGEANQPILTRAECARCLDVATAARE